MSKDITDYIRTIPDFPHAGIMLRDVTTLFGNAEGFKLAVSQMVEKFKDHQMLVFRSARKSKARQGRLSMDEGSRREDKEKAK